jgi:3-methyladenine DNA glycosylase Mpg
MKITRELNETDLTQAGVLQIGDPDLDYSIKTTASSRVGVKKANRRLWRFCIDGNKFLSRT